MEPGCAPTTGFRATNVRDANTFTILIDYGSFYEGKLKGVIPLPGKVEFKLTTYRIILQLCFTK